MQPQMGHKPVSYLCWSQARVNAEGSARHGIQIQYKTYNTNQIDIDMDWLTDDGIVSIVFCAFKGLGGIWHPPVHAPPAKPHAPPSGQS